MSASVWGVSKVRGQSSYVYAFVNDSLLESNGAICKHLSDAIRTLFITFEFSINSVFDYICVVPDLVVMRDSLRVLARII